MNPDDIVLLLEQRKWIPLAALLIGLVIRLLKSDTKLPTIPPRARIWAVVVLGAVSGALEHVISGKTWTSALVGGAVSIGLAIFGHETIIASLRAGKELPIPGLMIPGASPSPGAPPTDDDDNTPTLRPPPPALPLLTLCAFLVALSGCASSSRAQARGAVLATAEAVKVGDDLCGRVAIEKSDLALARSCAKAYDDARAASLTAASTVDAWDEGKKHDIACAVKKASDALGTAAEALRARGAAIPKIIDDARLLASALGGCS